MTKRRASVVAGLAVLFFGVSRPAVAQFASSIEGTVTDSSGAIVPGATVTVLNEDVGTEQSVTTTNAGYYRVPALPAALYTVRATLTGFKTVVQEHIRLQVAETKTINVTLEAGQVAGAGDGQRRRAPRRDLAGPGLGRDRGKPGQGSAARRTQLLQSRRPDAGRHRPRRRRRPGLRAVQRRYFHQRVRRQHERQRRAHRVENFLVDSSTVSSSQRSGVANITPNPEVVEEVRVAVNNFSAETGRNGSVLVNIVTKSGSNTWHGSASYFYTNNSLQAKNKFQQQVAGFQHPDYGRKEYSWGLGGPILKDRTFFFTSGDVLRSEVAISRAARIVTPQFIDFMKQSRPNNVSTYVMSTFPASFSAERNFLTAGALLGSSCSGSGAIDSPVGAIPCNLPVTGEGTFNTTSPREGLQWTARVDHHLNGGQAIASTARSTGRPWKGLFGRPMSIQTSTRSRRPTASTSTPTGRTSCRRPW